MFPFLDFVTHFIGQTITGFTIRAKIFRLAIAFANARKDNHDRSSAIIYIYRNNHIFNLTVRSSIGGNTLEN